MRRENRWWTRGYSWRGLAALAGGYAVFAIGSLVLGLSGRVSPFFWWLLPLLGAGLAALYAWRARRLYQYEKSRERDEQKGP